MTTMDSMKKYQETLMGRAATMKARVNGSSKHLLARSVTHLMVGN